MKEHADYRSKGELAAEIKELAKHLDQEYAAQSAERDAYFNDPANAKTIAARNVQMDLLEELYKARQDAGLTQAELADKMGVSQAAVAQIERGKRNLTLTTIEKYASACGKRFRLLLF